MHTLELLTELVQLATGGTGLYTAVTLARRATGRTSHRHHDCPAKPDTTDPAQRDDR